VHRTTLRGSPLAARVRACSGCARLRAGIPSRGGRRQATYQWVDHTGELELHIEAPTEAGVLGDALDALGELLGEDAAGPAVERRIEVAAPDRPALLAAWLEELVFLAETEDFVPEAVRRLALNGTSLRATVAGRRGRPLHLVKAVTYHRLAFAPGGAGWRATAVLDV